MAKHYVCDRCGKQIEDLDAMWAQMEIRRDDPAASSEFDLCSACADAAQRWVLFGVERTG